MYGKNITRNAVGRVARLGDLYDARTDSFLGFSVFSGPIPDDAIEVTDSPSKEINYIPQENILEKFDRLNILPELRASILANLVSLDGHGKYLENGCKNKAARKSMIYSIQTKVEKLIFGEELNQIVSQDSLDTDFATHFVVGITWGANTVISLEDITYTKQFEREISDELMEELRKLRQSIFTNEEAKLSRDYYEAEIFSDILPGNNSRKTLQETKKMLMKLPSLVRMANLGKGKPITYTLMPISVMDDYLNDKSMDEVVVLLDETAITNFAKLADEINVAKQKVIDVLLMFEAHSSHVPNEMINELTRIKSDLERQEINMRNKFKDAIVGIRSGKLKIKLNSIYENKLGFLLKDVGHRLTEYENMHRKILLLTLFNDHDVIIIGRDSKIRSGEIEKRARQTYVIYLRTTHKQMDLEIWRENRDHFFLILSSFEKKKENASEVLFAAIDLDVRPDLDINNNAAVAQICFARNGSFTNFDVYGSYLKEKNTCYARVVGGMENKPKPSNRIELKLRCPGSYESICENKTHKWFCFECKEPLNYGFDDYFYCGCGCAPSKYYAFKCIDERHGQIFKQFKRTNLKKILSEIPSLAELNVLILGVTGVGKSTWINAFLNYLSFPSLDEASENELLSVTSASFQLTDENDITHTVRIGTDENEVLEAGQSATQDVKAHLFSIGNTLLRLIDTPGIGDVRGVEQDKENFKKILNYLSGLKSLNGICILLKPNESRLNVLFEFCVKELLTHLHRNAARNIVFCFTHSRETFYKPGDTRQPLAELLWKNRIDLELTKNTMYCMDNESFRFLCAASQGVEFRDCVKKSFSESWNISVEETNRLISYFKTLEPHVIEDTISLNDARKNIVCLTKPIADISKNIQNNLAVIEDKRHVLTSSKMNEEELAKLLYLYITTLVAEPLAHPRTVCGSNTCVKYHPTADGTKDAIEYVNHCHPHCYLKGVPENIVGDPRLKRCQAMNPETLVCYECGCPWDQHLHITYEQIRVPTPITVPEVETKISGKRSETQKIENFIARLEELRTEQEEEQKKIIEVSVKLGRFLSKNAILPYNDVLGRYIDHLIEKEEQKCGSGGDRKLLKRLETMRKMYDEELSALKMAMVEGDAEELTQGDFQRLLKELYSLKHNGAQLQNIIEQASNSCGEGKTKNCEKFHNPKNEKGEFGGNRRFQSCQQQTSKRGSDNIFKKVYRTITTFGGFWR